MVYDACDLREVELFQSYTKGDKYTFSCFAGRELENMVLLYGKVFGVIHGKSLKKLVQHGSIFLIFLLDFGGIYHLHNHREVLFLRRSFVHKVED